LRGTKYKIKYAVILIKYLSKLLGRKVDLVRKPAIREELKDGILKEAVHV